MGSKYFESHCPFSKSQASCIRGTGSACVALVGDPLAPLSNDAFSRLLNPYSLTMLETADTIIQYLTLMFKHMQKVYASFHIECICSLE